MIDGQVAFGTRRWTRKSLRILSWQIVNVVYVDHQLDMRWHTAASTRLDQTTVDVISCRVTGTHIQLEGERVR